jgi:ADP-ribosyl-[dinitrogen reductase] hydrolase
MSSAPSPSRPAHGSCLCGAVRYAVTGPFLRANVCHCSRCRKHTGAAASTQGRVAIEDFRLLSGGELIRTFAPGQGMVKAFCSACGSSLFGGTWPDGPEVSIRLGTLDDDPAIRPSFHTFAADAPPWLPVADDGLARYDAARPAR